MKPLNEYVILEIIPEEKSSFAVEEEESSLAKGKVIAAPEGLDFKPGDSVVYLKYSAHEYRGQYLIKQEDIIAILWTQN